MLRIHYCVLLFTIANRSVNVQLSCNDYLIESSMYLQNNTVTTVGVILVESVFRD